VTFFRLRKEDASITLSKMLSEVARNAFEHFVKKGGSCALSSSGAAQHAQLLSSLVERTNSEACRKKIFILAQSYLKRQWEDEDDRPEKGAAFNANVDTLLKCLLLHSTNKLDVIEEYLKEPCFAKPDDMVSFQHIVNARKLFRCF